RWVVEALIALGVSPSARGFTASELARQVRLLSNQTESDYGPRRAAYECQEHRPANRSDVCDTLQFLHLFNASIAQANPAYLAFHLQSQKRGPSFDGLVEVICRPMDLV